MSAGVTAVTAVVALLSSIVAVGFALWPSLKPDPHEKFSAEVVVLRIDRHVTVNEWLHRITFSADAYRRMRDARVRAELGPGFDRVSARDLLALSGEVAYVESTLEGFKRSSVVLRWSLYDARTHARIRQFSGRSLALLRLEAPTDRTIQEVWLPPVPGTGPYFIRVALYDKRGVLLAIDDSARFVG
jgi:hypothetical protein